MPALARSGRLQAVLLPGATRLLLRRRLRDPTICLSILGENVAPGKKGGGTQVCPCKVLLLWPKERSIRQLSLQLRLCICMSACWASLLSLLSRLLAAVLMQEALLCFFPLVGLSASLTQALSFFRIDGLAQHSSGATIFVVSAIVRECLQFREVASTFVFLDNCVTGCY